jgi:zinc transport system substrate-binding protein
MGFGRFTMASAIIVAAAATSIGCRKPPVRAVVVATIVPVANLAERVAGPDADVRVLVGGDSSAHEAPSDVGSKLAGLKLAVRVGLGFDDWLDALAKAQGKGVRSLAIGDRVPTRTVSLPLRSVGAKADPHEDPARIDPYVWLDPQRMRLAAKAIGEELARSDASHAKAYRFRAGELDETLGRFDDAMEAKVKACAPAPVVVDAPVLGYFAERYGVPVVAVLRPLGEPPAAPWLADLRATVADVPAAHVIVTAREIQDESRALERPIAHVPIAGRTVEDVVAALVDAVCAARNPALGPAGR